MTEIVVRYAPYTEVARNEEKFHCNRGESDYKQSNLLSMKKLRKMNTRGHYAATEKEQSLSIYDGQDFYDHANLHCISPLRGLKYYVKHRQFYPDWSNKITNLLQFQLQHSSPDSPSEWRVHWESHRCYH